MLRFKNSYGKTVVSSRRIFEATRKGECQFILDVTAEWSRSDGKVEINICVDTNIRGSNKSTFSKLERLFDPLAKTKERIILPSFTFGKRRKLVIEIFPQNLEIGGGRMSPCFQTKILGPGKRECIIDTFCF